MLFFDETGIGQPQDLVLILSSTQSDDLAFAGSAHQRGLVQFIDDEIRVITASSRQLKESADAMETDRRGGVLHNLCEKSR